MNQTKLAFLIMQHILIVKIQQRELFQTGFQKDKTYEIARNCGYDAYQRALARMVNRFFDNKTGSGIRVNEQLTKE